MAAEPKVDDWTIYQGRTFKRVIRWETEPVVYKPITAIAKTAPVAITATGHGLKSGWYAAITDVVGMAQINAPANSPKDGDYHQVTFVDADTITLNGISAASYGAYTSGGYIRYNTPASLAGAVVRATVRNRVGGTALQVLSSATGEIAIDDTEHTITVTLTAAVTELITYTRGVYDLEVDIAGDVTLLTSGTVVVVPEITTV